MTKADIINEIALSTGLQKKVKGKSLITKAKMPQSSGERNSKKHFGERKPRSDLFGKPERKEKFEKKDQKSDAKSRSSRKAK
mgnify:CR=1 FL=1